MRFLMNKTGDIFLIEVSFKEENDLKTAAGTSRHWGNLDKFGAFFLLWFDLMQEQVVIICLDDIV